MNAENKKTATLAINEIIGENMKRIIEERCVSQTTVYEEAFKDLGFYLDRTTFNKYMTKPTSNNLPLPVLVAFCNYFDITFDELLTNRKKSTENKHPKILNTVVSTDSGIVRYPINELFVENPNSPIIKKYLQTYHCYYYSTVSAENKTVRVQDSILKGTLSIEPDGLQTKATLKIDTKKQDEEGNVNFKVYTGNVIVCPTIQVVHCILHNTEGEFCFLAFRFSQLFFSKQECRMAEVLSTSSTLDKRYPVVHRMLLSKAEISDEDLGVIAPNLQLNYSQFLISESALLSVGDLSPVYNEIVQEIFKMDSELVYAFKEKDIEKVVKDFMSNEGSTLFINELRAHAFAYRYNKISKAADDRVRDLLTLLGYFSK